MPMQLIVMFEAFIASWTKILVVVLMYYYMSFMQSLLTEAFVTHITFVLNVLMGDHMSIQILQMFIFLITPTKGAMVHFVSHISALVLI